MLVQNDAVEVLRAFPERLDLIATDVPYESLEKYRAIGTTTRLKKWFPIFPNSRLPELMAAAYAALRPNSHFYTFSDFETAAIIKPLAEAAGFKWWPPIVWDKVLMGNGYHYRSRYELILFMEKGHRALKDLSITNVLQVRALRGKAFYPAQKPEELVRTLVEQSSNPDETVCDPFVGSGTTAAVCLDRNPFVGCDVQPDAIDLTMKRLRTLATWLGPRHQQYPRRFAYYLEAATTGAAEHFDVEMDYFTGDSHEDVG